MTSRPGMTDPRFRFGADPLAPKHDFSTRHQRDLPCPVLSQKILRLTCRANHLYKLARSVSIRGALAIVTNVGRNAVDALARETNALEADGEVVWDQWRRFEVPAEIAASSEQELQIESGHWHFRFASAPCFPKFAKERAAKAHELRKAGTRYPDADIKFLRS
jgi:hypothetical protein